MIKFIKKILKKIKSFLEIFKEDEDTTSYVYKRPKLGSYKDDYNSFKSDWDYIGNDFKKNMRW